MPSQNKILGMPEPVCAAICGDMQPGQTAIGTTQANALLLSANFTVFTTVAAGTGSVLPGITAVPSVGVNPGDTYVVANLGANALLVYPPVGSQVNLTGANTGFSIASGKTCEFTMISATQWIANLSA